MDVSPHDRPATAGPVYRQPRLHSNDRNYGDENVREDGRPAQQQRPAPIRPSTQRNSRSIPRAAAEDVRRLSDSNRPGEDSIRMMHSEMEKLKTKLRASDFAKSQAQIVLQRQSAEIAKLERYISQLVEDRGGLDDAVLESVVKEIERSSRAKRAAQEVADLKSDLAHKEKQLAMLRKSQAVEYTLKLAEEKEALAVRVERLIAESNTKHVERDASEDGQGRRTHPLSASSTCGENRQPELEKLRAQNLEMRKESARLRTELNMVKMRGKSESGGGGDGVGGGACGNGENSDSTNGPIFYKGQAVECRKEGTTSWHPATIDSTRMVLENPGCGHRRNPGRYLYRVFFDDKECKHQDDIPENRIRAVKGGEDDDDPGQASCWVVKNGGGGTIVRSRVFGSGDFVFVRDGGSSQSGGSDNRWSSGKIVRRNDNGTYRVLVSGGHADGKDFHPTMLRAQENPGNGKDSESSHQKEDFMSPAEVAERNYVEKQEELLALARSALPAPLRVGEEVLARNRGSTVWGPGVVVATEEDNLRCSIEFDFGDIEESLPCIFVRSRRDGNNASDGRARIGDAVLVQKNSTHDVGGGDGRDWWTARFECYDEDHLDSCYVIFAGDHAVSRVRATRVLQLYHTDPATGKTFDEDMIPSSPPPPTKPVRAKKHREGDVVLACIPKTKKWTPALVTGVKGRGRYSVEWADGVKASALLFMYTASITGPAGGAFADRIATRVASDPSNNKSNNDRSSTTKSSFPQRGNTDNGDLDRNRVLSQEHGESTLNSGGIRLRQRILGIGEPVLARTSPNDCRWSPGCITRADGGGKYDVRFVDGTTAEDLSFLLVRGLSSQEHHEDGEKETRGMSRDSVESGVSSTKPTVGKKEPNVGDTVYVLKRGHSPENSSRDLANRDLWRVGTVTATSNGRFTVQYHTEEGKPKETRISRSRLRLRRVIRQKSIQKGDTVLALSNTPGRGWMMGAVTARDSEGNYTIAFADGTESEGIRFVNLRRLIGHTIDDKEHEHPTEKAARRRIRQRRFKKGEVALSKHPESRKWVVVKILEALPSGRYDLEFLVDGTPNASGVLFHNIRHLNLAHFNSAEAVEGEHDPRESSVTIERAQRTVSDGSWASDGRDERGKGNLGGSDGDREMASLRNLRRQETESNHSDGRASDTKALEVGSHVYVLRRGGSSDADVEVSLPRNEQDTSSWRPGAIVSVRGNGTFAVQYDEAGGPKEDRIAENRLRMRQYHGEAPPGSIRSSRGHSNARHNNDGRPKSSRRSRNPRSDGDGNGSASNSSKRLYSSSRDEGDDWSSRRRHNDDDGERERRRGEAFGEGDSMNFAEPVTMGGGRVGEEGREEDSLGNDPHRNSYADGQSTAQGSRDLSDVNPDTAVDRPNRNAEVLRIERRAVKMRKLNPGETVLARASVSRDGSDWGESKWRSAKVIKAVGNGNYSIILSGGSDPIIAHFTDLKPV